MGEAVILTDTEPEPTCKCGHEQGEHRIDTTVYLTGTYEILMPCDVCDCEEYRWSGLR